MLDQFDQHLDRQKTNFDAEEYTVEEYLVA